MVSVVLRDGVWYSRERKRHGLINPCPIAQFEEFVMKYLEAAEGSPVREELEQRFGRVNIERLICRYEEEKANLRWLTSSATKCPGCCCYVEKNMGCNHVSFVVFFFYCWS